MDVAHCSARFRSNWPVVLAAALALAAPAARAQDAVNVKEFLDRAQKKPQTEAVEDLIRKLKGGDARPPAPVAKEPAAPPAAAAKTEPALAEEAAAAGPAAVEKTRPSGPPASQPETPPAQAVSPPPPEPAVAASPVPPEPAAGPEAGSSDRATALPGAAMPQPGLAASPHPAATVPPPAPKAEVAQPLPSVDLEVHFDYRSAAITPQAVDLLITLGRALADGRLAGQTFLIAGHTDGRGGDAYNLKLSLARAEAVRAFLIKHFAIAPERLRAKGRGFRQLKNARNPHAAENRRVQITNISQQSARP